MSIDDLIREANSLSIHDRFALVDSVLGSIHQPAPDVESEWFKVAEARLNEVRGDDVHEVPIEDLVDQLRQRFPKV